MDYEGASSLFAADGNGDYAGVVAVSLLSNAQPQER